MRGEAAREGSDYCERQRRRMAREAARRKRQRKRLLRFIIVLLVMSFVTVLLAKATTGKDDKRPEEAPVPTAQQMAVKLENPAIPATLQAAPTQTPVASQVTEEPLQYIGEFRITHYCACERCCGKSEEDPWYGITATGTVATEGRIQYLGIAADEPKRIARHINRPDIMLPLVELGWEEDLCGLWCKYSDLLSPTYETSARGGCWFCHNQGVGQLRQLRHNHPDLWALLMKWDADSPVTFKAPSRNSPGRTVHEYDRRFQLEDDGWLLPGDKKFKWAMMDDDIQMKFF